MNTDDKIKIVLGEIQNGTFDAGKTLPSETREELKKVILMSEREGFVAHESTKQKLLISFMDGGFDISPSTFLTRAGRQFLEDYDRTKSQESQVFNIESVDNSAIGNYNTVNNYSEKPIEDLEIFIKSLSNEDETKEQGKELIETLKNEEITPGYLSKFEQLLQKHPKTVELISSFLTSVAVASIT